MNDQTRALLRISATAALLVALALLPDTMSAEDLTSASFRLREPPPWRHGSGNRSRAQPSFWSCSYVMPSI